VASSAARRLRETKQSSDQLVQKRRHRDARVVRHRIAQRERAMGGQFDDKPFGQRLDRIALVLVLLGRRRFRRHG
jgi:hypothetical protein